VAEALIECSAGRAQPRHAEIASHYERAGLSQLAITHYRPAAEAAMSIFANQDAILYFQRAVSLAEELAGAALDPQELAKLFLNLGDVFFRVGKWRESEAAFRRALAQPLAMPKLWQSALYRKISDIQVAQYLHPEALATLALAEKALGSHAPEGALPEQQEWIDVQSAIAQVYYWQNRWQEMDLLIERMRLIVERRGRLEQQVNLHSLIVQANLRCERFRLSADTVALAHQKWELSRQTNDLYSISYSAFQYGFVLLWHGDAQGALQPMQEALTAADRMGAMTLLCRCLAYLSLAYRKLGNADAVTQLNGRLLEASQAIGEHSYHGIACANRAWLAWRAGEDALVCQFVQQALECWRKYPGAYVFQWTVNWPRLAVAVKRKDLAQAQQAAQALLDAEQQPLLEPLAELLERALQVCAENDGQAALDVFSQALENAVRWGEF
jgi:tetratricopeptide (TPR) repeat protein